MREEWGSECHMDTQIRTPHADRALAALATRQYGVVGRDQAIAAGLTATMIQRRVASGHLAPLHRGVYAVGHWQLRREGFWLAAVLAAGPNAALSHRSAAALHGLLPTDAQIDVSTPRDRRVAGIRVHARRALDAPDLTTVDAIPTTTVARTLLDLASVVRKDRLAKAISEAERQNAFDLKALEAAMARARGRHGCGHRTLRKALEAVRAHGPVLTRSELEDRFLALLDAHRIERPRVNAVLHGLEVDALWPGAKLVVELDGYAYHRHREAFQRDRTRTNDLQAAGYRVLRFTYEDVVARPEEVARRVARLLSPAP
jgi:very-short-patch-repair endonuclease/predicted transcriptional regulator of viral defense system